MTAGITSIMGARKRNAAEARKEAMSKVAIAKLNDCPTSPRKMRLVADIIRGKDVVSAECKRSLERLRELGAEVSAVAQGVPVGGSLEYLDDGTLLAAMNARRSV